MMLAHPEFAWWQSRYEPLVFSWDDSWYSYVVLPIPPYA